MYPRHRRYRCYPIGQSARRAVDDPSRVLGASQKSALGSSGRGSQVVGPTGEYEKDKLINVGANRWAVKAELGYVIPVRARDRRCDLAVAIFSDNDDFLGVPPGQRAVGAAEIHFVEANSIRVSGRRSISTTSGCPSSASVKNFPWPTVSCLPRRRPSAQHSGHNDVNFEGMEGVKYHPMEP